MGSCLCSAESISVAAAGVVGVFDVFTLEVEVGAFPVRRGSILGGLEHLRRGWGRGLLHCRVDGRVGDEENRGRRTLHRGPFLGRVLGGCRRADSFSVIYRLYIKKVQSSSSA